MADFELAFNGTMGHEIRPGAGGRYSNDPSDRGGETYCGIARKRWRSWPGWKLIDGVENKGSFLDALADELDPLVRDFYLVEFWGALGGAAIESQAVAEELFDTGVNMGVERASEFLQRALNGLNRSDRKGGEYFPDLKEDGDVGPVTLGALEIYLDRDSDRFLMTLLNVQQGAFYLELMRNDPSQERFTRGWLKRVELVRSQS